MHSAFFEAPGWSHAVLIHNGGWDGDVTLRAWVRERAPSTDPPPDYEATLTVGKTRLGPTGWLVKVTDPREDLGFREELIFAAAVCLATNKLRQEIGHVVDNFDAAAEKR